MKVYVVTQTGGYYNYRICGVADTMEKAQKLVEYFEKWGDSTTINIYDTNTQRMLDKKRWKISYKLPKLYGNVSTSVEEYSVSSTNDLYEEPEIHYEEHEWYDYYSAYIIAKDEMHALKIFYNKLAEYMARQQDIAI